MSVVTLAVNEKAFNKLVLGASNALAHMDPLTFDGSLGPLSVDVSVGFKVGSGNIVDLTSAGTVVIDKLKITYDPLVITFGIDIGPIVIEGPCIDVWVGTICLPDIPIIPFSVHIPIPIDLSGLIESSYQGEFSVSTNFQTLTARTGMGNHQAHDTADGTNEIRDKILLILQATSVINLLPTSTLTTIAGKLAGFIKGNLADKEQFFLHEIRQNINLIDVGDTVKNILTSISDKIIDAILGWAPSSFRDIVKAILSPVFDAIAFVLDIPSDVTWWLEGFFGDLGILNMLLGFIEKILGAIVPVYQFETPYPIIEDSSGLIPVLVGINNLDVTINDDEFILTADIL